LVVRRAGTSALSETHMLNSLHKVMIVAALITHSIDGIH
jgi:hypothetical protein